MSSNQIPIEEGLFTWPSEAPALIGGKCPACGELHFPVQENCPACAGRSVDTVHLSRRGTLWTWTVQSFPPPVPPYVGDVERFEPFGVGYIALPEGLYVEARLTENDAAKLRIGMDMEMTAVPFGVDEEGREIMTFAFRPS